MKKQEKIIDLYSYSRLQEKIKALEQDKKNMQLLIDLFDNENTELKEELCHYKNQYKMKKI